MTHDKLIFAPKIALYEPDIPQNTAAIIRTCSCLGATLEIIEPCGFLFTDKRFRRVAMDYMEFDKIKFVGTLKKEGTTLALVQTEGQRGHTVKVGTLIGPNLGIVKTVNDNKIVILERYRNYLGEILSRPRNIEFKKNPSQG